MKCRKMRRKSVLLVNQGDWGESEVTSRKRKRLSPEGEAGGKQRRGDRGKREGV